jgi:hypothetical protein
VSDEAFVLLSIENCWEAIQLELEENDEDGNTSTVYTRGKFTSSGTNVKFGGWSLEGIKRFNDLYELVEKNRNEPWAKTVEEQIVRKLLIRHHATTDATNKVRRKKRHGKTGEEDSGQEVVQIKARSSLWSFGLMDPTGASISIIREHQNQLSAENMTSDSEDFFFILRGFFVQINFRRYDHVGSHYLL